MNVARYTHKHFGIPLPALKRVSVKEFMEYEEMMYMSNDYEYAQYKQNEPKKGG